MYNHDIVPVIRAKTVIGIRHDITHRHQLNILRVRVAL